MIANLSLYLLPCELGGNKPVENDVDFEDINMYREIIGSLIYIMTCTRPDICFVSHNSPKQIYCIVA